MAYSFAQLESFAIQGGFPASLAPTMAAIAMAESSGNNVIQQGQPYSTTGWGLWQITPGNSVPQVGTDNALLNPVNNARAAFIKWSGAGGNEAALRSQWTTYRSGAYLQFMPAGAVPPANDGSTSSAGGDGSGTSAQPAGILGDVLSPVITPFEHAFDIVMNHVAFVLVIGAGLGAMGIGLVLMLKEAAGGSVTTAVIAAAKTAGKVVK